MTLPQPLRPQPNGGRRRPRPPYRPPRVAPARRSKDRGTDWWLVATGAFLACAAIYLYAGVAEGAGTLVGLLLIPVFTLVALVPVRWLAQDERSFDFQSIALASLALHFVGAYFRLRGGVDSVVYHNEGVRLAEEFRELNFAPELGRSFLGTGFLRYLSGLVHVVTFDHRFATFMIFTFFAFLGGLLLYRAFTIGLPEGDRKRYALLVLLWPSLVFWPSSLGKEAWMLLAIGITALGAARLVRQLPRGFLYVLLGLGATLLVRPHVALLLLGSVFVAYLFRSNAGNPIRLAGKIVGIAVLLGISAILASQTTEFFDVENLGADSLEQVAQATIDQTNQGGSAFAPTRVTTPLHYPLAAVTVLFRPFPFEASSPEMLLTSLEALVLAAMFVLSAPRLMKLPQLLRRRPYLVFAGAYTLTFIWAFSAIGNFGILVRQRTQVLPFVLVFAALPAVQSARRRRRDRSDVEDAAEPDPSAP